MTSPEPAAVSPEDAALLAEVVAHSGQRLQNPSVVSSGGRFLLARAWHVRSKRDVLLMIARPTFAGRKEQLSLISDLLAATPGSGLGDVIDRYWHADDVNRWGCLAITWHDRSLTLEQYLPQGPSSDDPESVLAIFRTVLMQVRAMHDAGFVHGDLSPANILVSPTGTHVSDLEYVTNRKFVTDGNPFATKGFAHPSRLGPLQSGRYTMRDAMAWDRYSLGKVALFLLSHSNPYNHPDLTLFNQRALRLVGGLLMGKAIAPTETALGLDPDFFAIEGYDDLNAPIAALDRLIGTSSPEFDIPELRAVQPSVVEMGLHKPVSFTNRVRRLVDSTEMQQLASCLQLGLISFIWPTATHTRIQHSLGTFGMACSAVVNLYADPQSPFFRVLIDARTARALIAAALLHDVGHYPLAHDLEEAFDGVFDHEARSVDFIENSSIAEILRDPEEADGWEVNPSDVASIIAGSPIGASGLSRSMCGLLHSVISGALDVDKLDYLIRDSHSLGVAAGGGIDVQRVLSSLTIALVPVPAPHGRRASTSEKWQLRLAVSAKGIRPAELVGRIRSHMFGVTYWHHSYRAIKSMIHWLVWKAVWKPDAEPSAVKRNAERLAADLFASLGTANGSQIPLPGFGPDATAIARVPAREASILTFVDDRAGHAAGDVVELLLDRSWFRSVLTVEHFQNVAVSDLDPDARPAELWNGFASLMEKPAEFQVQVRIALAEEIQREIRSWVEEQDEVPAQTLIFDFDKKRDRFLFESQVRQLFLLDLVKAAASDKPLYFVSTERPGSRLTDTSRPLPVRRSYDQNQLNEEFLVSNGAIRVLAHPEFDKFIADAMTYDELLDATVRASRQVLTKYGVKAKRPTRRQ